jgi:uncharacterized protein
VLPPAPARYLNDYAGVVSPADARRLEDKLRRFDDETSSQIVVAVFSELPSPSLEDFTARTAESWKVGRKELDNGAVLFVFVNDRKIRLEVGYGLEGALPDITARRIIEEEIAPRFREGRFGDGLAAGVDAIMAATRGEYTARPRKPDTEGGPVALLLPLGFIALIFLLSRSLNRPLGPISRRRRRRGSFWYIGPGGFGGGGWGGGGSGGGGGFGGGGFSGGGGSFGGGGASGSW